MGFRGVKGLEVRRLKRFRFLCLGFGAQFEVYGLRAKTEREQAGLP